MLGEQFDQADFVMGMVLKLRPQFDKIDVWMNDATNEAAIAATKSNMLSILQCEEGELEFQVFSEWKDKNPAANIKKPLKPTTKK